MSPLSQTLEGMTACTGEGCDRRAGATRGLCREHYLTQRMQNDPADRKTKSVRTRFGERHETPPAGCWLWTGALDQDGYGYLSIGPYRVVAYVVSYWLAGNVIPPGLVLDHFACDNRACVNPDHVRPVTNVENVMRGQSIPAQKARQTRCGRGHPFSAPNTYVTPDGRRQCRTCKRGRGSESKVTSHPSAP